MFALRMADRRLDRMDSRACSFEHLESRDMLSGLGGAGSIAHPLALRASVPGEGGYTPAEIAHAYGLDRLAPLSNGASANGAGQTIAIVDAYDDPTIASDLRTFDQAFGLPAPRALRRSTSRVGRTILRPTPDGRSKWPWMSSGSTPLRPVRASFWSRPSPTS